MTRLLGGFHPSFDALSAHADRSDMSATRTRVGLHVSRCAACAQAVAEIHALGEAAREQELPGVSADVWARIDAGVREADREVARPVARADEADVEAPSSADPIRHQRTVPSASRARLGLGFLIASGGALVAMLWGWGAGQDLGAAPLRRLTLDHTYVMPGSKVHMRYRPAPVLADQQSVTVWARYSRRDDRRDPSLRDALTRAGVLDRSSGQELTGSITLPTDVQLAGYVIGDSLGLIFDRSPGYPRALATVVATDRSGTPDFDALVTLLGDWSRSADDRAVMDAARQLEAHYPDRPETWILTYPVERHTLIADLVKRFESRERVYATWHGRLKARRPLSAETELMMANLANDLMDTVRADFWLDRLIGEHGSHPAVPQLWIARYRDVPNDSISAVLASFEPIWQAAGSGPMDGRVTAVALAERSRDAELMRLWRIREAAANPYWVMGAYSDAWLADPATRAGLARLAREQLAAEMRDTVGAPTMWFGARWATNFKLSRRHLLRTRLAAIQLLDGDVRGARVVLDSLAAVSDRLGECQSPATLRWRAEAERQLGELDAARDDLAYLATTQNWQIAAVGDSAPRLLGAAFTPEGWGRAKQAAALRHRACFATHRDRTSPK